MVDVCGGGGLNIQKLQMISNKNHFIRTSFKQTKHLLTLFMSCEQKRMGLGGCWVFLNPKMMMMMMMMSVGAFCSNDGVILLPD